MKREAIGCTKMKRLCQRLGIPQYIAVGILESLWHLTAKEAPQGDIGKLSNDDIALGLDWKGDADELIAGLVQARWLDEQDGARLIVHDWHLHCEDTIDVRLARNGLAYASGNLPRMSKLSEKERGSLCAKFSWKSENGAFVRTKQHKKALPVPKPLPIPKPLPEQKPSRRKATSADGMKHSTDPKHVAFKEAIHAYWKFKNGDLPMPWGAMEGAQLGMWLRDAPHITLDQFKGMLQARAKSKVNHGERPAQWIKWITSYGPGPVNEFKNTMEVGGEQGSNQEGSGASKPSPARERVDGARRVLANIAVKRGFIPSVGGDGAVDSPLSQPGSGIEHRAVLQGLRAVGSQAFPAESREGDSGPSDQAGPVILPASR